jgi:uncharacterized protein YbjT (DUF2867 family)
MKILVLGATGGTGQLIVRDAAQSGHSVVALVRAKARADVAQFVVEQLTTDTWLRRTPVILW